MRFYCCTTTDSKAQGSLVLCLRIAMYVARSGSNFEACAMLDSKQKYVQVIFVP